MSSTMSSYMCCTSCGKQIARQEHIISLAREGLLAAYLNPSGHVHDTLTLSHDSNLRLLEVPRPAARTEAGKVL